MRHLLFVTLLVAVSAAAAPAAQLTIMADSWDVVSTSVAKVNHSGNITTGGTNHVDIEYDQSFEANSSEIAYFTFPYPPNLPDGTQVQLYFTYETTETNTARTFCPRTTLVGYTENDIVSTPNLDTGALDVAIQTLTDTDGQFLREHASGGSTLNTIRRASNLGLPCTQAGCAHHTVRGAVRWMTGMPSQPSCATFPSSAAWRIKSVDIIW